MGIYMLLFSNGQIYIGKSKNINERILCGHLTHNQKEERVIYDALSKSNSVTVRVLHESFDEIDLSFWERVLIHEQAVRICRYKLGDAFDEERTTSYYTKTINSVLLNKLLLNG
jgi:hypothetical protein